MSGSNLIAAAARVLFVSLLMQGGASFAQETKEEKKIAASERVVEGTKYPAILLATGEGDTSVPPQQAVKMAAKLQWASRSSRPVLAPSTMSPTGSPRCWTTWSARSSRP